MSTRAFVTERREEIARIIDGVAFRPQHISGAGLSETEKEKWLRARNVAYYKADAILALPVPCSDNTGGVREALEEIILLAPENEQNVGCNCTVCQARRIAQRALAAPQEQEGQIYDGVRWQAVNNDGFEYAIQQGQHGDEFVKLLNGACLRRCSVSRPRRGDA